MHEHPQEKTLYEQVQDCVEDRITLYLFQLRVLTKWLFRNEVDGFHVDKLRQNMEQVGFLDEELTVMRIPDEDALPLRTARPLASQSWTMETCTQEDTFPYITCPDTDKAGKLYPLYGVFDGNHRALAGIMSVLKYNSIIVHANTTVRVRVMKFGTDMKVLEVFSMVSTHT